MVGSTGASIWIWIIIYARRMLARRRNYAISWIKSVFDTRVIAESANCRHMLSHDGFTPLCASTVCATSGCDADWWIARTGSTFLLHLCLLSATEQKKTKNELISFGAIIIDCDWLLSIRLRWVICNQSMRICVHSHWALSIWPGNIVKWICSPFSVLDFSRSPFFPPKREKKKGIQRFIAFTLTGIAINLTLTVLWPTSS